MTNRLKVFIVEDEIWVRRGIIFRLSSMNDMIEIVGEAGSYSCAFNAITSLVELHVLFTDIVLPDQSGLKLIESAKQLRPDLLTYIISGYSEFEYAQRAINLGVNGYLLKPIQTEALNDTIKKAYVDTFAAPASPCFNADSLNKLQEWVTIPERGEAEGLLGKMFEPLERCFNDKNSIRMSIVHLVNTLEFVLKRCGVRTPETEFLQTRYIEAIGYCASADKWIRFVLQDLLCVLEQYRRQNARTGGKLICDIKQYSRLHYQEDISLESLSAQFAISPAYLSRLFKAECNEGISEYIARIRIDAACTLLRGSNLSTNIIAERVNYADASYFAKVFRRHVGCSPTEYRKKSGR